MKDTDPMTETEKMRDKDKGKDKEKEKEEKDKEIEIEGLAVKEAAKVQLNEAAKVLLKANSSQIEVKKEKRPSLVAAITSSRSTPETRKEITTIMVFTLMNALIVTASTAELAEPPFLLNTDRSGTKTKAQK